MKAASTEQVFRNAVTEVLEQFAFMFPDDEPAPGLPDWPGECLHAAMSYTGPARGSVSLAAPAALCAELAANVLGAEPGQVGPEAAEDALKELLNIICGKVTADLYGEEAVIDLTVPTVAEIDAGQWRELSGDSRRLRFTIEQKPMLAALQPADLEE